MLFPCSRRTLIKEYNAMCRDKVAFTSTFKALRARERASKRTGQQFNAYECPFCQRYHIGHAKLPTEEINALRDHQSLSGVQEAPAPT
jgi:hypothetical protein